MLSTYGRWRAWAQPALWLNIQPYLYDGARNIHEQGKHGGKIETTVVVNGKSDERVVSRFRAG